MSKIEFDRRDFLKVMGVSGVAATVAGCDMPSYITSEEGVEEVIINPEAVEGRARPLYIYADRREDVGSSA